ncbi:MAG: hypothetical protein KDD43_13740, partial [Bdellovibrionales bacterium]|nr:hypothetical protein [Bdellovibrionales bacterium]
THINSMIWSMGPHKFGVQSYRFWKEESPDILATMLSGRFEDPDKIIETFSVMPHLHQHH